MERWRPSRNWGARATELTLRGIDAVALENELLRITVLTGKGTDLVEFLYKPMDLDFVWLSPTGLRDPWAVTAGAGTDDGAAFLDAYPGGWQEILPNGGAPSEHRGVVFAQHGEVATVPWDCAIVADSPGEVAVRCSVEARRMPLRLVKMLRLRSGTAELEVVEQLTNLSAGEVTVMWGQHITFGAPFLRPGCAVEVTGDPGSVIEVVGHPRAIHSSGRRRVAVDPTEPSPRWRWPTVPSVGGGEVDLSVLPAPATPSDIVYLTGFGGTGRYTVRDPDRAAGLTVTWDAEVLPWLWMWQEFGATVDYPWWGRAYVLGLEPFAGYPTDGLAAAAPESLLRIAGGETRTLRFGAAVVTG